MHPTHRISRAQSQRRSSGGGPVSVERAGALAEVEIGSETRSSGGGPVCVERVGALAKVEIGLETRPSR